VDLREHLLFGVGVYVLDAVNSSGVRHHLGHDLFV